jgi:hypothetical protein
MSFFIKNEGFVKPRKKCHFSKCIFAEGRRLDTGELLETPLKNQYFRFLVHEP